MDENNENENNERVSNLVDTLVEDLENMGLYVRSVNVMGQAESEDFDEAADIRTLIADGEASYAIVGMWQIGDVAWQEKILNPDAYDEAKQFQLMMPTKEELMADKAAEAIESGVSIFDIDLDFDLDGGFDDENEGDS